MQIRSLSSEISVNQEHRCEEGGSPSPNFSAYSQLDEMPHVIILEFKNDLSELNWGFWSDTSREILVLKWGKCQNVPRHKRRKRKSRNHSTSYCWKLNAAYNPMHVLNFKMWPTDHIEWSKFKKTTKSKPKKTSKSAKRNIAGVKSYPLQSKPWAQFRNFPVI